MGEEKEQAWHVGNTGSSTVGTTNNSIKGLDDFLSPLIFR
jgi:hypothetical protein